MIAAFIGFEVIRRRFAASFTHAASLTNDSDAMSVVDDYPAPAKFTESSRHPGRCSPLATRRGYPAHRRRIRLLIELKNVQGQRSEKGIEERS